MLGYLLSFITICCGSIRFVMLCHKLERHDSSNALFLLQVSNGVTTTTIIEFSSSELLHNLSLSFNLIHKLDFFHDKDKKCISFLYP